MFDSKKIDAYFEEKMATGFYKKRGYGSSFSWARFVKLFFPCAAAAIFGLMIVLPNIKKSADIQDQITLPKKSEMEKLHAETVVMNATDKKNRVSTIFADNMDEVDAGADEIKIHNPHANIPSDNGNIKIKSEVGFVNQKTKILNLENNVMAKDEKNNVVSTQKATYDFDKELGYGNSEVFANGDWGKLSAQGFKYDKNSAVLTLLGLTVAETKNGTLTSHKETQYFQNEEKIVSIGEVAIKKEDRTLKADKIINYLTKGSKKELKRTEAYGNVQIITPKGTVKGKRANYDANSGTAEVFENVIITSEKGTAYGDHAVYDAVKNTVDLYGNVVLKQGANSMRGHHAHTDLNTSVSTLQTNKQQGSRVSGTFYKKGKERKWSKNK